ncbi:hypothetical protein ACU686_44735 [Yinghuangia aomiensis]
MTVHADAAATPGLHLRSPPHRTRPAAAVRCGCVRRHTCRPHRSHGHRPRSPGWPRHRKECTMGPPFQPEAVPPPCGCAAPSTSTIRSGRNREGLVPVLQVLRPPGNARPAAHACAPEINGLVSTPSRTPVAPGPGLGRRRRVRRRLPTRRSSS